MTKTLDISLAVIVAFGLGLCVHSKAHSRELVITQGVPTVAGVHQGRAPHRYYDQRQPVVTERPGASVSYLRQPAPDNGCPQPAFRVISGPAAEQGCFGALR